MSYEPSHRKPPRQERWPHATPQEGWPAYLRDDGYRDGGRAQDRDADRRGWADSGYQDQPGYQQPFGGPEDRGYSGYRQAGTADVFGGTSHGYAGTATGYGDVRHGSGRAGTGYGDVSHGTGWAGTGYGDVSHGTGWAGTGYGDVSHGTGWAGAGYGESADEYSAAGGYGAPDEYAGRTGYSWNGNGGYGGPGTGYDDAWTGYGGRDGQAATRDAFPDSTAYLERLDQDEHADSRPSGPLLIAPDTIGEPEWLADRTDEPAGERDRSGLIVGAVTGLLAAAVAIGVATLAAAFVRPQASPIIAVGGAFIDRTPSALKNFAVEHFGENDKTVLLLGMYVTIAFIAMAIGCLTRRSVTIGVAGIAAFGLFGAFAAITRPDSHLTDVIPSVVGGIAGVLALLWLDRAAAPVAPLHRSHVSSHRAAR